MIGKPLQTSECSLLTATGPRVRKGMVLSGPPMNSSRARFSFMPSRIVRVVAVLFLLYTGVEITVPEFCSEASGAISISRAAVATPTAPSISAVSDHNQKKLPSEQPSSDEDCFCCCAHVVPARGVAVVALSDLMSSFAAPPGTDLPSPPLQSPYHPPRLA